MDEELDSTYSTLEGVPYVRLFADYGESPVWTWEPLDYAELQLPPDLEARMRAWEAACYADDIDETSHDQASQRHRAEGILIAGQLAGELGSPLAVHYASADPAALARAGVDDVEDHRLSLADPAMFHVDTFPVRPSVTRDIVFMLQHPFERPDDAGGSGTLDADWSDLGDDDDSSDGPR